MAVRPATPGDLSTIADMWVDLATDQRRHGAHVLPDRSRDAARETLARAAVTGGLFVAVDTETLCGFAATELERGRYATDITRGLVTNLYVVPDHRGEGLGGALLDAAERSLAERGAEIVSLETLAANESARRFYERQGFERHRVVYERRVSGNDTDTSSG